MPSEVLNQQFHTPILDRITEWSDMFTGFTDMGKGWNIYCRELHEFIQGEGLQGIILKPSNEGYPFSALHALASSPKPADIAQWQLTEANTLIGIETYFIQLGLLQASHESDAVQDQVAETRKHLRV
jgi:hypothetical protein